MEPVPHILVFVHRFVHPLRCAVDKCLSASLAGGLCGHPHCMVLQRGSFVDLRTRDIIGAVVLCWW